MSLNKRLKVFQIIPVLNLAGAERMVTHLTLGLNRENCEVTLISFYKTESVLNKELKKNNVRILYLDKKSGFDIFLIKKLFNLLKKEKPDIVHTHLNSMVYVSLPCILLNIPIIHTVHNIASKELPSLSSKVHKLMFKHKKATPVAISPNIQETITHFYRITDEQVPMIYNGIDLSKCIKKQNYTSEISRILHIGRFSYQKNHEMLINSFYELIKDYPKLHLYLAGIGELMDDIKSLVTYFNLDDKVTFLGQVDNIYTVLNKVDLFVLPSNYEGFPMTIIEALGTGLPVIATNVGGVKDIIIDEYNGLLCGVNKNDFCDKLKQIINDQSLYIQLATHTIKSSKKFSVNHMTYEYIKLYYNILK